MLLKYWNIKVIPQKTFNVPEIEETGLSFVENALLKARHCTKYTKLPVLADDSGLCVDWLSELYLCFFLFLAHSHLFLVKTAQCGTFQKRDRSRRRVYSGK